MPELFEHAFAVIDSAITAALISGVSPRCLLAVLSYAFLNVAARARSRSDEFEGWLSDPDLVWEPILGQVLDFLEQFDGSAKANRELVELEYLRTECKIKNMPLSEIEEHRQNKIAFSVISWLLENLAEQNHEEVFIECAFFVQWIKVSALMEDCSERNYLIVRQNVPDVAAIWDGMFSNELSNL